ncbi:NAD-dependent epimerase/dehydratase family protein [Chloroflexota bacterium]
MDGLQSVLVTGGAEYVGSVLVPKLLDKGHRVKVLDLYIYGDDTLDPVKDNPNLEQVKGDIRDRALLERLIPGTDCLIHLACISNDPSFELDPDLGKSVNYDAFFDLVDVAKENGIQRFIYASSSSVYGVKEEAEVTEDMPLEPLTDYSKYKALCEKVLLKEQTPDFVPVIIRSVTICGYSPRLRLDLIVNILTSHAINVGREDVEIVTEPTNDPRSYHISSEKIRSELGWQQKRTIEDAVRSLCNAFRAGKVPDSMDDIRYYNVKMMQAIQLR